MNAQNVRELQNQGNVYDLNARLSSNMESEEVERLRTLDEIHNNLRCEEFSLYRQSEHGNEYEVKTFIRRNNREWYFSSFVIHNGKEIVYDPELIRHEQRRKPVLSNEKIDVSWDAFVKEAASIHLEKCNEVKRRFEAQEPNGIFWKKVRIVLIGLIVLSTMSIAGYYFLSERKTPKSPKRILKKVAIQESKLEKTQEEQKKEEKEPSIGNSSLPKKEDNSISDEEYFIKFDSVIMNKER